MLAPVLRRIDGSPKAAKRNRRQKWAELAGALALGAVGICNSKGKGYVLALSLDPEQRGKVGNPEVKHLPRFGKSSVRAAQSQK